MSSFNENELQMINDCFDIIVKYTKEAGEFVKEGYAETNKHIDTKQDASDMVTEYDKKVEKYLMKQILAKYPNHRFIAEETAAQELLTDSPTWIIDPIDGTNNFVRQIPLVAISIAMVLKRRIVIGIIYNPILNEFYSSKIGNGAFLNGRQIFCRKTEKINESFGVHEATFIRFPRCGEKHAKRTIKFAKSALSFRAFGCAAISLAYLARGTVDFFANDDLNPWDYAAGVLLITEAGGYVCNSDGSEFDLMRHQFIAASSKKLCQEIVVAIREADEMIMFKE